MRFTKLTQQMGQRMPFKVFRSGQNCVTFCQIVTRLVRTTQGTTNLILKTCPASWKSCHDWTPCKTCSLPAKVVTRYTNRVTILNFAKKHFWGTLQQFSTLPLKWWWCHFNHQPPFSLTLPWTIPQDKINQVQSPAWTLIHTPTSTCIQPPSVVPQASKSYSLHPTTLCSSTNFHLYLFKPRNVFRPLEDPCIQLH